MGSAGSEIDLYSLYYKVHLQVRGQVHCTLYSNPYILSIQQCSEDTLISCNHPKVNNKLSAALPEQQDTDVADLLTSDWESSKMAKYCGWGSLVLWWDANVLMHRDPAESSWSEMEKDCLMETLNLLQLVWRAGAFLRQDNIKIYWSLFSKAFRKVEEAGCLSWVPCVDRGTAEGKSLLQWFMCKEQSNRAFVWTLLENLGLYSKYILQLELSRNCSDSVL